MSELRAIYDAHAVVRRELLTGATAADLGATLIALGRLRAYAVGLLAQVDGGTLDEAALRDALRAARDLGQRVGALAAGLP